ncbi:tetratricopeptide repeat protein [Myroides sp. LJL119]
MSYKQERLNKIKELYDKLNFVSPNLDLSSDKKEEIYLDNKQLSEHIWTLIQDILEQDPYNSEALFWKIKIHEGPYFNDVSVMIQTSEFIIENLKSDLESIFTAYHWLAWCYDHHLQLTNKSIEILHDLIIEISLIKDDISLQDKSFGEAYYLLALLYCQSKDYQTAAEYYRLSTEHYPDHYKANYNGALLFLNNQQWDQALQCLQRFCTYFHTKEKIDLAQEINQNIAKIPPSIYWDFILLQYQIELEFFEDFQAKNRKEISLNYQEKAQLELTQNPNNLAALQMRITHFLYVEKNSKVLFDLLDEYFAITGKISNSYYSDYFHLSQVLEKPIRALEFDLDGFSGYNLMTKFLEKADSYRAEDSNLKALVYYEKSQEIGLHTLELFKKYQDFATGDKINNNKHNFAMLCNNLSIAVRNIAILNKEQDYTKLIYSLCISLNKKGFEFSPFWENLDSGLRLSRLVSDFQNSHYFACELLKYYDSYTVSWMEVQALILKNYIDQDHFQEATRFYEEFHKDFLSQGILDQDVLAEMVYIAADYFTYLRFNKQQYDLAITYTQEFFAHPIYFDNIESIAKINYWFSLAWCYHALEDQVQGLKYFSLIMDNYKDNPDYQLTIQEIPLEYSLPVEQRQGINRLRNWVKLPIKESLKNFDITDNQIDHVSYLEHIVKLITRDLQSSVKSWIDSEVHIEVVPRHIRQSVNILCFDTYIDIYLASRNITLRFILTETQQERKTLFGLIRSLVWQKNFTAYVYYYQDSDQNDSSGFERFEDSSLEIQELLQGYWNQWLSKL